MGRVIYLDCFSGVSGDMLLGAFLDAGLPLEELRRALGSLALDGVRINATRVVRAGVTATKFQVEREGTGAGGPVSEPHAPGHPHRHESHHDHPHHHDDGRHHRGTGRPPEDRRDAAREGVRPLARDGGRRETGEDVGAARAAGEASDHGTRHAPGHDTHAHRSVREIEQLIAGSALSPAGQARACALVRRLAEAEAAIHGVSVDEVHLHEVGAIDSIIDIVGAVFAFEYFAADRIVASPLNVGRGTVACAHGTFPVPAPATLRLLVGVPIYDSGPPVERVTPTGALLVTGYAAQFGPLPPMRVERVGYGAGDRDVPELPNVLRLLVGTSDSAAGIERVLVLEFEVDDMNPQLFGVLMERLYAAGALEVFYAPVQMKKNRPGVLVTVLAPLDGRERVSEIIFSETTTLGLRVAEVERERLDREERMVATPVGGVRVKLARRGGRVVNVAPEFDDCVRLAAEHRLSVKQVQALALKAYLDQHRSD